MQKINPKEKVRQEQRQPKPGLEYKMSPRPVFEPDTAGKGKLAGKKVLITGGDSGIGRAVAVLFAQQGADVGISYLNEDKDAETTKEYISVYKRKCLLIPGDISHEPFCKKVVKLMTSEFGRIDVLVNNAGTHEEKKIFQEISPEQLMKTFSTNFFSMFWMTQYALNNMSPGSSIVNTASVTAYRGSAALIDYSASKGAIVSFTRSLSANLADKGIRVNAVAPGPIWTPLIASSFSPEKIASFGTDTPLKRAGEPAEIAPAYLFLACEDSAYMTGQVLHPNGGEIVNG